MKVYGFSSFTGIEDHGRRQPETATMPESNNFVTPVLLRSIRQLPGSKRSTNGDRKQQEDTAEKFIEFDAGIAGEALGEFSMFMENRLGQDDNPTASCPPFSPLIPQMIIFFASFDPFGETNPPQDNPRDRQSDPPFTTGSASAGPFTKNKPRSSPSTRPSPLRSAGLPGRSPQSANSRPRS